MYSKTAVASTVGVVLGVTVASLMVNSYRSQRENKKKKKSRSKRKKVEETKFLLKDPNAKYDISLVEKKPLTTDTNLLRFKFPNSGEVLGCPTGKHVFLSAKVNEEMLTRPYSPISDPSVRGFVDFAVKIYKPNADFPQGGVFSQFLDSLNPGELFIFL
ncbi:hypothetical protein L596_028715 [Steinernema carpocapsae]|uniref:FAD-binding FR-type domain-containing protein n=1 Tax=Steinernema carpocapsae TaxID=34508 RepID=A0A4V5ZXZ2_STECR|nr:hypothetical protein L596_028715 [Steinernema carpocapsae]